MEPVWTVPDEVRQRYLFLFRRFLNGGVGAQMFSATFLDMWRNDRDSGVTTGEAVDFVMTAVDCYEPEPHPESDVDIDEAQLRAEVARAAQRLAAQIG